MGGTFTFASLDAYEAGRPTTFTQRSGNPLVEYSHVQFGGYVQDDVRVARSLSMSAGLRYEVQTHADDYLNFAPRFGTTWSPFKSGKTTIRGGAGIFYEWYDSQLYEQTLRVDGTRQTDLVVQNPGFPDPFVGGDVVVLPSSRYLQAADLTLPRTFRTNVGVEQVVGKYGRRQRGLQLRARIGSLPRPQHQRAARRWQPAGSELGQRHADRVDGALAGALASTPAST